MKTNSPIHEVFVYSSGAMHEKNPEALAILQAALGSVAISEVGTPAEAGAMIVMGGDGTFLHAMGHHEFPNIPVTGVNTGTLGFYMDTPPTEQAIGAMARQMGSGAYTIKSLPLLELPIGQEGRTEYATNEIVVQRAKLQAFQASLRLGEGEFEHFVGDGFIFATPQGSTSYSLSAGGPILHEDIDAYVVTPSNPHKSHRYYSLDRTAIVPSKIESVVTVKDMENRPFAISVDDRMIQDWPADQKEITVRVAQNKRLQVIRFDGHDYFDHVSNAFRGKKIL